MSLGEGSKAMIKWGCRARKGLLRAKVIPAATVYQQDELRGVKEVIRSFARNKVRGTFRA